ncbi:hypothetical protein NBRC116583_33900 [Arenicella sp. 4NH20-0111]|uniref:hypothetical protein n=1 Tax=Arenicella sp. 4NH20-0111 TaxID=3127648 RepID=UPI0031074023
MNKLAIALLIPAFATALVGCSSGSSEAPIPASVTNRYQGTFQNTPGTQSGSVSLNLSEDTARAVTGNIIFTSDGSNCLRNATVTGTTTGFNFDLTASQAGELFTTTTTITRTELDDAGAEVVTTESITVRESTTGTVGTVNRDLGGGRNSSAVTTSAGVTGNLNMQFNIGNNGATLQGTYVTDGDICSNNTGSGVMSLNRI